MTDILPETNTETAPRRALRPAVLWLVFGVLLLVAAYAAWNWRGTPSPQRETQAPAAVQETQISLPLAAAPSAATEQPPQETLEEAQQNAARLAALEEELQRLKEAAEQAQQAPAMDGNAALQLETSVRALSDGLAGINTSVSAMAARLAALEAVQASQPFGGEAKAMAYALGLRELERALTTSAPFAVELETLAKLLDAGVADAALTELRRRSDMGIATSAQLVAGFDSTAAAMVRADAAVNAQSGWTAKTYDFVMSLVTIRPLGERAGTDAPSRIARAQMRLNAGDLAAALAELEDMAPATRAAGEPWITDATDRLRADQALAQLTAQLTQQLGTNAAPQPPEVPLP